MEINRYLEIRNYYKKFVYQILNFEEDNGGNVLKAAKRLGFLAGERQLSFEDDEESNVLMDYLIYEKNGMPNRITDRYAKQKLNTINELEKLILKGMRANHYSLFEIIKIDSEQNTLELKDQLGEYIYTLKDIGLSITANIGMLIATRLIPIEDIHTTSGLTFAFDKSYRRKLLTEISKHKRKSNRRKSLKINKKKKKTTTLLEMMFNAHKKWGLGVLNLDYGEE